MSRVDAFGLLKVGHDLIDRDHADFLDLLGKLSAASDGEFPALFADIFEHIEQHFERENQLMRDFAFPAETEHRSEHQRVIGEFRQFKTRVERGLIQFGRGFVEENLPGWFKLHVSTMDSALAAHIKARNAG